METVGEFFRNRRGKKKEQVFFMSLNKLKTAQFRDKKLILQRPVDKKFKVSSPFGVDRSINNIKRRHLGIDFAMPEKTNVYAMAPGKVFRVGFENDKDEKQGFGYRIWQEAEISGHTFYLWYAHLAWSMVHQDYEVEQGEHIAMSGNTGFSTGPHLHVQARKKNSGTYYDMEFFDRDPYRA